MKQRTFEEFLADVQNNPERLIRSEWLKQPTGLKLYVRRSIIPGGMELANLELAPRKQKKGIFSAFLAEYETQLPLLIENVQNNHLEHHLRRRPGWRLRNDSEQLWSPTFLNELWV